MDQRWNPYYLGNPIYDAARALLRVGVALHDLEVERLAEGQPELRPSAPLTVAGNATANLVRNVWAFIIIFCGHFPEGAHEFTEEETAEETRGEWYFRQVMGRRTSPAVASSTS
jgi:NADPH-dependent stearoyl-CoA 9-desaturase